MTSKRMTDCDPLQPIRTQVSSQSGDSAPRLIKTQPCGQSRLTPVAIRLASVTNQDSPAWLKSSYSLCNQFGPLIPEKSGVSCWGRGGEHPEEVRPEVGVWPGRAVVGKLGKSRLGKTGSEGLCSSHGAPWANRGGPAKQFQALLQTPVPATKAKTAGPL